MDYRNFLDVFTDHLRNREQCPIMYQKYFSRNSYAFSNSAFTLLYSEIKKQKDNKAQNEMEIIKKELKRTCSLRDLNSC